MLAKVHRACHLHQDECQSMSCICSMDTCMQSASVCCAANCPALIVSIGLMIIDVLPRHCRKQEGDESSPLHSSRPSFFSLSHAQTSSSVGTKTLLKPSSFRMPSDFSSSTLSAVDGWPMYKQGEISMTRPTFEISRIKGQAKPRKR